MTKEFTERQFEIIEAAGRILTVSGVSGLTIKNLANEMKFTEGAIYRHFMSREDVIVGMLNFLSGSMDKRLAEIVSQKGDAELKFTALFQSQFQFFYKNPHFVVSAFCDGLMEESDRINKSISAIMEVKRKYLISIVKEGQKSGLFTSEVGTEDIVNIITGTFRLEMFRWRVSNFQFDIRKKGAAMMQSVLHLIKTNK